MSNFKLLVKAFGLLTFAFGLVAVFSTQAIGVDSSQQKEDKSTEVKEKVPQAKFSAEEKSPATEPKLESNKVDETEKTKPKSNEPEMVKNPTIKHVQQYYNAGNYAAVLAAIKKIKPTCMTHYYTGLAYQHTNRHYKAAIEYNYVKNNAKDAKLKYNAAAALKSLYRQKKQLRTNRRDHRNRLGEYQRHGENNYPGGPSVNDLIEGRKQLQQARRRRPNQDRYYRSYKIPKGLNKTPRYKGNVVPYQQ